MDTQLNAIVKEELQDNSFEVKEEQEWTTSDTSTLITPKQEPVENNTPMRRLPELDTRFKLVSPLHHFPFDIAFFERNRHPSIREMLIIAKESGVTYTDVFKRFETLRYELNEPCQRGDSCSKVRGYFKGNRKNRVRVTEKTQKIIHTEFIKMRARNEMLTTGFEHLLMEKTHLGVTAIRREFNELYELTNKVASRKFPEEPVITKTVKRTVKPKVETSIRPYHKWYPNGQFVMVTLNQNYEICYDHDYLQIQPSCVLRDYIRDQLMENRMFFLNHPHPSIREMIEISAITNFSYLEVYSLFTEWRKILGIKCLPDDQCQKVAQYMRFEKPNGSLTMETRNILIEEFEKFKTIPHFLDLGYIQLYMHLTDLPSHVIRRQFAVWKNLKEGGKIRTEWRKEEFFSPPKTKGTVF